VGLSDVQLQLQYRCVGHQPIHFRCVCRGVCTGAGLSMMRKRVVRANHKYQQECLHTLSEGLKGCRGHRVSQGGALTNSNSHVPLT